MNDSRHCPEPLPLARLARGDGTEAEFALLDEHLAGCAACREEWTALEALSVHGGAAEWSLAVGAETDLPDQLWRSIEAARRPVSDTIRLALRMGAALDAVRGSANAVDRLVQSTGRALSSVDWLSLLGGSAALQPVAAAPMRGLADAASPGEAPAVRLTAGPRDILLRRSGERLTVVVTEEGHPSAGCRIRLQGPAGDRDERTDLTGIVVFRALPAGDYRLDIEEAQA